MTHSRRVCNNPYPESNQPDYSYWQLFKMNSDIFLPFMPSWAEWTRILALTFIYLGFILTLPSHICLDLTKDLFPISLPATILKEILTFFNSRIKTLRIFLLALWHNIKYLLILCSYVRLGLPKDRFPVSLPAKI